MLGKKIFNASLEPNKARGSVEKALQKPGTSLWESRIRMNLCLIFKPRRGSEIQASEAEALSNIKFIEGANNFFMRLSRMRQPRECHFGMPKNFFSGIFIRHSSLDRALAWTVQSQELGVRRQKIKDKQQFKTKHASLSCAPNTELIAPN